MKTGVWKIEYFLRNDEPWQSDLYDNWTQYIFYVSGISEAVARLKASEIIENNYPGRAYAINSMKKELVLEG